VRKDENDAKFSIQLVLKISQSFFEKKN